MPLKLPHNLRCLVPSRSYMPPHILPFHSQRTRSQDQHQHLPTTTPPSTRYFSSPFTRTMSSDEAYASFLDKANQPLSTSTNTKTTSSTSKPRSHPHKDLVSQSQSQSTDIP